VRGLGRTKLYSMIRQGELPVSDSRSESAYESPSLGLEARSRLARGLEDAAIRRCAPVLKMIAGRFHAASLVTSDGPEPDSIRVLSTRPGEEWHYGHFAAGWAILTSSADGQGCTSRAIVGIGRNRRLPAPRSGANLFWG
jgi:hypothetical protein